MRKTESSAALPRIAASLGLEKRMAQKRRRESVDVSEGCLESQAVDHVKATPPAYLSPAAPTPKEQTINT